MGTEPVRTEHRHEAFVQENECALARGASCLTPRAPGLPLLRVLLAPVTIYDSGYVQKVGLYSFDMARPLLSRQQTLPSANSSELLRVRRLGRIEQTQI